MSEFKNLKNSDLYKNGVMDKLGNAYVTILKDLIKRHKKIATSDLLNSISYKLVQSSRSVMVRLIALDYLINVDRGRKAGGKMPPDKAIRDWVKVKGIPESAIYPIRRKIAEKGIKKTDIIQGAENIFIRSPFFKNKFPDKIADNLENYITEEFEKINKK